MKRTIKQKEKYINRERERIEMWADKQNISFSYLSSLQTDLNLSSCLPVALCLLRLLLVVLLFPQCFLSFFSLLAGYLALMDHVVDSRSSLSHFAILPLIRLWVCFVSMDVTLTSCYFAINFVECWWVCCTTSFIGANVCRHVLCSLRSLSHTVPYCLCHTLSPFLSVTHCPLLSVDF